MKEIKNKYWYRTFTQYCPVCGDVDTIRERVYSEKPTDIAERIIEEHVYDYCNAL